MVWLACSPHASHKILSTFFDDVPTPEEKVAARARADSLREISTLKALAEAAEGLDSATSGIETTLNEFEGNQARPEISFMDPRSLLEDSTTTWDIAQQILPKTLVGDIDWVKAISQRVIAPRSTREPTKASLPFTLDTIVPNLANSSRPPLDFDVELIPENQEMYKVVFPHAAHSMWLNCSTCHPGIREQRAPMKSIFKGEYCGKCHGKVAFDPRRDCSRCHVNLKPGDPSARSYDLVKAKLEPLVATKELISKGKAMYEQACATCHGLNGDGRGPFADELDPKPRDFTLGTIKFRTTQSDYAAADEDIFRAITRGIPGTSMPSWADLSYEDRWGLVHYVKSFSDRYEDEDEIGEQLVVGDPPEVTPELIAIGADFFVQAGCNLCHGDTGAGNGQSAASLVDEKGDSIPPYDFTGAVPPKSGETAKDLYRTLMTGVQGTPMPSYGEVFQPEQAWAMVFYLQTLKDPNFSQGRGLSGTLHFSRKQAEVDVPPAIFPHWFHRVRFRCSACHPQLFQTKMGSTKMSMVAMQQGEQCAKCHNGKIAWQIGFRTCVKCHVAPQ